MPIHLIWGDDFESIDRTIEKLIQSLIDPNWISMNLTRLDGQHSIQAHQALEEVRTPPFGNGNRVIVLKKNPFFNGCSIDLAKHFESVIDHIPEKTHLILNNQNKPDNRLKTTKQIKKLITEKKGFEVSFNLPAIWDELGQQKLIQHIASELNILIEDDAIFALIEAIGNDSKRIAIELKKLLLLEEAKHLKKEGEKIVISKSSVKELVQGLSSHSLQICNYLLNKEWGKAIKRIDSLLNQGEPALRIVATFTTQIRGWLWVSILEKENQQDVNFLAKKAGIANPKRIYVIRKQIKGKSTRFFIDLLNTVLEIETLLKKGVPPKDAFRDGLLTIC